MRGKYSPIRKKYDFTDSVRNPYAKHFRKQVTIRLGTDVIEYFKNLAKETDLAVYELVSWLSEAKQPPMWNGIRNSKKSGGKC